MATLAPGASASFVSTVQATGEGKITLHASARAKNSLNQTVESNTAESPEVTIGPFIVLIRLSSTGAKSQILPGGQVIRDYPQAYFTRVKYGGVLPHGQIKTWYAIDSHNYNFVLGNDNGMSSELREPEKWAFYAYHNKRDLVAAGDSQSDAMRESALIITMHSPVLTLYTDAHGRRMGAAGPLTSADFLGIDAVPPLTGGGSLWEIPGGAYIAPGIHTQFGVHESCAEVIAEEQVVIPLAEADGPFSLLLTGTGDGTYRVAVQHATESGTTDLYSHEGTIAQGEAVQLDLQVDRSGDTPVVEPQSSTLTPAGPPCFGLPLVSLALLLTPLWARQRKASPVR